MYVLNANLQFQTALDVHHQAYAFNVTLDMKYPLQEPACMLAKLQKDQLFNNITLISLLQLVQLVQKDATAVHS